MSLSRRIVCIILGIFSLGNDLIVANIRGTPGVDYPSYSSIPRTSFKCSDQEQTTGFYADPETRCQVFHYCYENRQETFLCPIGTTFNQAINSCDYWYSSECDSTEVIHAPVEEQNGFNDQPFIPVTSPPYNVYEKMIALRDSNGNLEGLSVIEDTQTSFSENNHQYYENGDYFTDLPTSLTNLEEVPQKIEQDLNFVAYGHEAVGMDDTEVVFSEDEQLKTVNNEPNYGFAEEEDSYRFSVPNEPDNLQLDTDEILQGMYQKEYSSELLNVDPSLSNEDDSSSFGFNSDAMLHKRFSEVESKKRRIRRKPKYVVLQTNVEKNYPEHETEKSSNTLMVTYASDSDTNDSNENAAEALQFEYGKTKRNRKPLRKDNTSRDTENLVTFIDRTEGFNENVEHQSDQTDAFDDSEIYSDVIKLTSPSNFEDVYESESVHIKNADEENDNSEIYSRNLDSNDIFILNEANALENQQLNLEESTEADESHLESDTESSYEMNELLIDSSENSYQLQKSDPRENDFLQEYAEENLGFLNPFLESENVESLEENFDSSESSDSYTPTNDITESLNSLGHIVSNNELEENQKDQIYLEFTKEEQAPTSNDVTNNGNNVYFESVSVDSSENLNYEDPNTKEKDGSVRVNNKYPSFEKTNFELSNLKETVENYDEDIILSTDEEETNFEDTLTEAEVNTDSLEYFESEGQGYFIDEHGRIFVPSGENEESEVLIYVGDIDPEGHLRSDMQYMNLSQTENSPQEATSMQDNSNLANDLADPVEVEFNSIDSKEIEFGKDVAESQDLRELTNSNSESFLGEDEDQPVAGNSTSQKGGFGNFLETATLGEQNNTIVLQVLENTVAVPSNLNLTNAAVGQVIDVNSEENLELEGFKEPLVKEISGSTIQDLDKPEDSKFPLSSIPLPANEYEKGLYNEQVKNAQDTKTINNKFPGTFYKELQAVPVMDRNNPIGSKTIERDYQLLNIKTRLFRNIKSDLASDEVKSAVDEIGFPSEIIDSLFSSFSRPYQSVQGYVPGHFPMHSPKFRNIPDVSTRTGKMIKPSKIFKLINIGKKLLKMKRAKLYNTVKEYFNS